ncbi:head-tail connector protein [Roseovarius sp. C03]|uniref:head-tail connector protein n=1 Tax=Roseovarius sp. C03 TaxID=3449222 RepID=UPI003EDBA8C2
MAVKSTTPPAVLPVELDDLKAHLRVTSDAEDPEIAAALAAAVAEIDGTGLLGRAMISQGFEQSSGPVAARCDIELDITPAQSLDGVDFVKSDGSRVSADLAGFELISDGERAWIRAASGWPSDLARRPDAIRLTYTAGFGDTAGAVPEPLRAAVKLLAAHRFEVREEVVIGTITSQIPRGVDHILDLYRLRRFS